MPNRDVGFKVTADTRQYERSMGRAKVSTGNVTKSQGSLLGKLKAAKLAWAGVALSVLGFVTKALRSYSVLQDLEAQFSSLTGSMKNAKDVIRELTQFTAATPFQLEGVSQAAKTLLGFGFSQKELIPILNQTGDVAAALGSNLNEVARIYGKINAQGRVTGETFEGLITQGVNLGPAIADHFGVAEEAVRDLLSEGKVTGDVFNKLFSNLNKEGGIAFEGMAKRSRTLSGRFSTMKDNVTLLMADIGEATADFLNLGDAMDYVTRSIQPFLDSEFDRKSRELNGLRIQMKDLLKTAREDDPRVKTLEMRMAKLRNDMKLLAVDLDTIGPTVSEDQYNPAGIEKQRKHMEEATKNFDAFEKDMITQRMVWKKKKREKEAEELSKWENLTEKERLKRSANFAGQFAALQSSRHGVLAHMGKAAAVTQATIDAQVAYGTALAAFPPPFGQIAAIATLGLALANVDKILNTPIPKFAQGGIVPGNSFSGDNVPARVNSGEMILNMEQQARLFDVATGAASGGTTTVVNQIMLDRDVLAENIIELGRDGKLERSGL